MPVLNADRAVVVAIDFQGKLVDMIEERDVVLAATRRLLKTAELFDVPIVLTEQYPKGIGPTRDEIFATFEEVEARKAVVEKTSFSCCGEPEFVDAVARLVGEPEKAPIQVVVAGIEAHICVVQTVADLVDQGFEVHVCWDCVSGRGARHREHAIERMRTLGAEITNVESVGFELARDKDHPSFKPFSGLLKEGQLG